MNWLPNGLLKMECCGGAEGNQGGRDNAGVAEQLSQLGLSTASEEC
jgi:hypothetical protein